MIRREFLQSSVVAAGACLLPASVGLAVVPERTKIEVRIGRFGFTKQTSGCKGEFVGKWFCSKGSPNAGTYLRKNAKWGGGTGLGGPPSKWGYFNSKEEIVELLHSMNYDFMESQVR